MSIFCKSLLGSVTILLLTYFTSLQAQIVIPFAFWKSPTGLAIDTTLLYMNPSSLYTFTASGATGAYTWAITGAASTDLATITPSATTVNADYSSRATSYTTDTVSLSSGGNTLTASVVTYDPLTISPTTVTMVINTTQTFTGLGGCLNGANCVGGSRVFSLTSGVGSINASTGVYTAPAGAGTAAVQVADSIGNVATATITVVSSLAITPATLKIAVYSTNQFSPVAGSSPYSFSMFSGTGTVSVMAGLYTAPAAIGVGVVRVTDSASPTATTADAPVTIVKPTDIKAGQYFACALYSDGSVKCWGTNTNGQLGIGSTATIGDAAAEVGGANAFVDLGTSRTAQEIAVGLNHVCARLDNATVKCWGQNSYGQLGRGNTTQVGSAANQMGNTLTPINLGTGRTATAIYAFGYHSCAKLDDLTVKCWGRNNSGQLGQGDTNNRGDNGNEMGDFLLAINVGTGKTVSKLSGGLDFTCALLNDATVKCFGGNSHGQLGKDNSTNYGSAAGQMGDSLLIVNINGTSGGTRTATDISSGYWHTCVKRDNGTAICWGRNSDGQSGTGTSNGQNADIGDTSGEMAAIVSINMSTSFGTLSQIFGLGNASCAMDTVNLVKCWGRNAEGELEYGNTTQRDAPIPAAVNFGTGLVLSKISGSYYTICALFTNDRIKCWGRYTNAGGVSNGVFLNAPTASNLGIAAGNTADNLSFINH